MAKIHSDFRKQKLYLIERPIQQFQSTERTEVNPLLKPSTATRCCLFNKDCFRILSKSPPAPINCNSNVKPVWFTESKAELKSKETILTSKSLCPMQAANHEFNEEGRHKYLNIYKSKLS